MFELKLNVTKVVVMIREGTDQVIIHTDLPSPYVAEVDDEPLQLQFGSIKGMGIDYVRAVFGVEPEIIDVPAMVKAQTEKQQVALPYEADKWSEVRSSNISCVGLKGKDLLIKFKNGATYRYPGKARYYGHLMESDSKGKAFFRIKAALLEHEKL